MLDQEEDLDTEEENQPKQLSRKKMLIFLLPVLIVIGLSVGFYYAFNRDYQSNPTTYSVVKRSGNAEGEESFSVFYDLPEFKATLHSEGPDKQILHLRLNLELSDVESVKMLELLMPKINDIVLTHIIELSPEEVEGSTGLYWLKEELLYRLNLIMAPIKINSLSIKSLEIQTTNN